MIREETERLCNSRECTGPFCVAAADRWDEFGEILGKISPGACSLLELAALIQRMSEIRWRVSHKQLILLKDWVSRPLHT